MLPEAVAIVMAPSDRKRWIFFPRIKNTILFFLLIIISVGEKMIDYNFYIHCSPHGIFNLSDPGGVSVIRKCQQRGFHAHGQSEDGSPIYKQCSHVYMNAKLKFDVIDLRSA